MTDPLEDSQSQNSLKTTQKKKAQGSMILVTISFILAGVLLYFTFRGLDWGTFFRTFQNGKYTILLFTLPLASLNYFIRSLRWNVFVSSEKKIPALSVFWANMVGYMGNSFLPARAGEIIRSVYLGEKSGLGTSYVLATALTERILDALALVIIGSISLTTQTGLPAAIIDSAKIVAIAGLAGLVVILLVPSREKTIQKIITNLPFLPITWRQKISEQVARFLVGMKTLQNPKRAWKFALFTLVIWFVDGFGTTIGVKIISQSLSIGQALIFLAGLGLSSAIPSTPGYVGVYQLVAVTILMPFGFSRSDALTYILISQIANYLVVSLWGLIGLAQMRNSKTPRSC
jgi:uncharacterized protein (TIRG00374 family)